jgi:cytochrome c peroxidase
MGACPFSTTGDVKSVPQVALYRKGSKTKMSTSTSSGTELLAGNNKAATTACHYGSNSRTQDTMTPSDSDMMYA